MPIWNNQQKRSFWKARKMEKNLQILALSLLLATAILSHLFFGRYINIMVLLLTIAVVTYKAARG